MKYLLDVNILVAWGWADHVEHDRTARWIAALKDDEAAVLMTSALPQLGFVRVSIQRSGRHVTIRDACVTLASMVRALGRRHEFLADDCATSGFPAWCQSASRTTDAHLVQLATQHGATLATLDEGIPGAFVIPS